MTSSVLKYVVAVCNLAILSAVGVWAGQSAEPASKCAPLIQLSSEDGAYHYLGRNMASQIKCEYTVYEEIVDGAFSSDAKSLVMYFQKEKGWTVGRRTKPSDCEFELVAYGEKTASEKECPSHGSALLSEKEEKIGSYYDFNEFSSAVCVAEKGKRIKVEGAEQPKPKEGDKKANEEKPTEDTTRGMPDEEGKPKGDEKDDEVKPKGDEKDDEVKPKVDEKDDEVKPKGDEKDDEVKPKGDEKDDEVKPKGDEVKPRLLEEKATSSKIQVETEAKKAQDCVSAAFIQNRDATGVLFDEVKGECSVYTVPITLIDGDDTSYACVLTPTPLEGKFKGELTPVGKSGSLLECAEMAASKDPESKGISRDQSSGLCSYTTAITDREAAAGYESALVTPGFQAVAENKKSGAGSAALSVSSMLVLVLGVVYSISAAS